MIQKSISETPNYDRDLVDFKDDSSLMAYLFTAIIDPVQFQTLQPLSEVQITPDLRGLQFGNLYLINIGSRFWTDIALPPHTLVITHAKQPRSDHIFPQNELIEYPDSTPAFIIFAK